VGRLRDLVSLLPSERGEHVAVYGRKVSKGSYSKCFIALSLLQLNTHFHVNIHVMVEVRVKIEEVCYAMLQKSY